MKTFFTFLFGLWVVPASWAASTWAADQNDAWQKPITMNPIGVIRAPYVEVKEASIHAILGEKGSETRVELQDKYVKGLKDLDAFSYAILIYYYHLSDKEEIVTKPYLEQAEHGIFATRTPHRPNHLGFAVVRIKRIEGNKLYFTEADVLDGTPVLDIKPYVKQFDNRTDAVSGWMERRSKGAAKP